MEKQLSISIESLCGEHWLGIFSHLPGGSTYRRHINLDTGKIHISKRDNQCTVVFGFRNNPFNQWEFTVDLISLHWKMPAKLQVKPKMSPEFMGWILEGFIPKHRSTIPTNPCPQSLTRTQCAQTRFKVGEWFDEEASPNMFTINFASSTTVVVAWVTQINTHSLQLCYC